MIKKIILISIALSLWFGSAQALDTLKYAVCDTSLHKDEGYDSLFVDWTTWEGLNLNLPTLNSVCIVDFYNDGDTLKTWGTIDISGWNTSDSEYIELKTPASERHDGTWGTGFRVTTASSADLLTISEGEVRVDGLALYQSNAYDIIQLGSMAPGVDIRISNCLLKGSADTKKGIYLTSSSNSAKIRNNFFDTISGASGVAIFIYRCTNVWIYNNSAYDVGGPGIQLEHTAGHVYAKNNIIVGSGGDDFLADILPFAGGDSSGYNCSGDATAPGSNSIINKAAYDVFVDTSTSDPDLHLKLNSVCIDSGVDLSSDPDLPFSNDIDGDTRSGTWDIGADEYMPVGAIKRIYKVNIKGVNIK